MADANLDPDLIERINRELALYGQLTQKTAQDLADVQTGIKNFDSKIKAAGGVVGSLTDAFVTYNKEIYRGSTANAAATASVDKLAEAVKYAGAGLALLVPGGPLIKGLVAGLGLLTAKFIETGKLIGEQTDSIYKAYREMARAGAVGAGGMQDVFDGLQRVGLGVEKFNDYLRLVNENSMDLANFGTTVNRGRLLFEQTMKSLTDEQRTEMEMIVGNREQQAEATLNYIKQQRVLTRGTRDQMDTSSAAVMRYVKETDLLTRITGLNRKEQEKLMDDAMRNEAFNATLQQIREEQGDAAAKQVQAALMMARKAGPETAKQFMDSMSGFVGSTNEAGKAFLSTGGKMFELTDALRSGQLRDTKDTARAMNEVFRAYGQTAREFRGQAQMMNFSQTFGSFFEAVNAGAISIDDLAKIAEKTGNEQKDLLDDDLTKKAAKMENDARQTQIAQQKLVNLGMETFITANSIAAENTRKLAEAALAAAEALRQIAKDREKTGATRLRQERVALDTATDSATKATDKEKAILINPKATAEQKAEATRQRQEAEAAVSQKIRELHQADLALKNLRKKLRRAGTQLSENPTVSPKVGSTEAAHDPYLYLGDDEPEPKAKGGPVSARTPYLVGEEGPELFVPSIAGDIVPTDRLKGTTGTALRQNLTIENLVNKIVLDTAALGKTSSIDLERANEHSTQLKEHRDKIDQSLKQLTGTNTAIVNAMKLDYESVMSHTKGYKEQREKINQALTQISVTIEEIGVAYRTDPESTKTFGQDLAKQTSKIQQALKQVVVSGQEIENAFKNELASTGDYNKIVSEQRKRVADSLQNIFATSTETASNAKTNLEQIESFGNLLTDKAQQMELALSNIVASKIEIDKLTSGELSNNQQYIDQLRFNRDKLISSIEKVSSLNNDIGTLYKNEFDKVQTFNTAIDQVRNKIYQIAQEIVLNNKGLDIVSEQDLKSSKTYSTLGDQQRQKILETLSNIQMSNRELERIFQNDFKIAKDYNTFYKKFVESKKTLELQQLESLESFDQTKSQPKIETQLAKLPEKESDYKSDTSTRSIQDRLFELLDADRTKSFNTLKQSSADLYTVIKQTVKNSQDLIQSKVDQDYEPAPPQTNTKVASDLIDQFLLAAEKNVTTQTTAEIQDLLDRISAIDFRSLGADQSQIEQVNSLTNKLTAEAQNLKTNLSDIASTFKDLRVEDASKIQNVNTSLSDIASTLKDSRVEDVSKVSFDKILAGLEKLNLDYRLSQIDQQRESKDRLTVESKSIDRTLTTNQRLMNMLGNLFKDLTASVDNLVESSKEQTTIEPAADSKDLIVSKQIESMKNFMLQPQTGDVQPVGKTGGTGLQLPSRPSVPDLGGAQGLYTIGQDDLTKMGLKIKKGDVQADNAGISPALIELAKKIQSLVPGFKVFTGFNDRFHQEKAPSSQHTKGLALDFALDQKPSVEDGRAITDWLKSQGASLAIDEYNNPSRQSTGGHIHAQIPAFEDGGKLGAERVGIAGESGPELITGPADITPMNDLMRAFGSMTSLLEISVSKLDAIARATAATQDVSSKMLSYAQN